MSKSCTRCGEVKPVIEFNKRAAMADGFRSECRACQAAYKKGWYDPDRERVKRRAAYLADPERHRQHSLASHLKRYPVDPEYRARMQVRSREWRQANADLARVRNANKELRRRAAKRGVLAEKVDRLVLFERDGGLCGICGGPVDPRDFHVDHRMPLARGGTHTYENTQIAHPCCNLSKGARLNYNIKVG